MKKIAAYIFILFMLTGCGHELPNPQMIIAKASERNGMASKDMNIHYVVQGNKILVECIIPAISFSGKDQGLQNGKIDVYVNGHLHSQFETAAFIVRDLKKGNHSIKVDVVNMDNQSLGMSEQFSVTIN